MGFASGSSLCIPAARFAPSQSREGRKSAAFALSFARERP
jgi:hypothetical protein